LENFCSTIELHPQRPNQQQPFPFNAIAYSDYHNANQTTTIQSNNYPQTTIPNPTYLIN